MNEPRSNSLSGAELEDDAYRAEVNGDEAVGGTTAIPSQNDTEELAEAVGVTIEDGSPIAIEEMMEDRDRDRWELDPASAIDI